MYAVGPEYAHAEARKSPVVDGVVNRSEDGKEIRYPVMLSRKQKKIAHDVATAFRQTVCGFDILICGNQSYVCDVNGWSFVKNSPRFWDDSANILRDLIIRNVIACKRAHGSRSSSYVDISSFVKKRLVRDMHKEELPHTCTRLHTHVRVCFAHSSTSRGSLSRMSSLPPCRVQRGIIRDGLLLLQRWS